LPDPNAEAWPPQDPDRQYLYPETDPNHKFTLPDSPWTYENGSLNPELQASNTQLRSRGNKRRKPGHAALPPYHPDFNKDADEDDAYSASASSSGGESDEDDYDDGMRAHRGGPRVRSGSEGYEARPVDREEQMRRFLEGRLHEPGRYQMYVPETHSESETDEDLPLAVEGH